MITYNTFKDYQMGEVLIDSIVCQDKISQAPKNCFHTVFRHLNQLTLLEGDVVECGIWKGGFSIFLSHIFPEKIIWACDSFDGFQDPEKSNYPEYKTEFFTPDNGQDWVRISVEEVVENFRKYHLSELIAKKRIRLVKGFVKDTLPTCGIEKISLLRIDVDAYAATREVLDALYPKVVSGGMIIFDDSCLYQTVDAIRDYFNYHNISIKLQHPENDGIIVNTETKAPDWSPDIKANFQYPTGCYMIKS